MSLSNTSRIYVRYTLHEEDDDELRYPDVRGVDGEAPSILGLSTESGIQQNLNLNTNADRSFATIPASVSIRAVDNVELLNLTEIIPPLEHQYSIGKHNTTVVVYDSSGNTDLQVFEVTVVDNQRPTTVCRAATMSLNVSSDDDVVVIQEADLMPIEYYDNSCALPYQAAGQPNGCGAKLVTSRSTGGFNPNFGPGTHVVQVCTGEKAAYPCLLTWLLERGN